MTQFTASSAAPPTTGSILVAEDEEDDVLLIQRAFKKARVANPLHVVRDGQQAVEYLAGAGPYADRQANPMPVMLLLDLKMPRKNGHEVLEWIRAQPTPLRRLPVVVLTSSREAPDVNRAFELGASSYLLKPVSIDGLVQVIQTLNMYWFIMGAVPEVNE
ncbi:MAG TPA: response regulator [Phycisphaerales bacterium]|nr:response regulator [Phycisphaerales bacterium]